MPNSPVNTILYTYMSCTQTRNTSFQHIFFQSMNLSINVSKEANFHCQNLSHKNNLFLQQSWFWLLGKLGLVVAFIAVVMLVVILLIVVLLVVVHLSIYHPFIWDLGHKSVSTLHVDCGLCICIMHPFYMITSNSKKYLKPTKYIYK